MTDWRDQGADDAEPEALSMFPPGALIAGKYRIEHLIGRGGMGSVWAATHIGLGQVVAIKLISRRYAASREARQRFDMEAKAVAQLRSRHVVQVFDNGETEDGTPYIAMELLEGESLDQRINKGGPMPIDAVVRIATQVSRALSRAHALGIVHRDLKPENIFLTRSQDDDEEIAKVLDFGIAKIKRTDGSSSSSTRTGAVLGTPLFMSPEQARGLKTVDHRTDVYSLGMVIYMMLTGRPAISGDSFGDILVAICTQPLPPICSTAPWLPPSLDAWFQRACAREPADRFQTPDQLMEGLVAAAGGRPLALVSQQLAVAPQPGAAWQTAPGVGGPVMVGTYGPAGQGLANGQTTSSAVYVSADQIPRRSLVVPFLATLGAVLAVGAIVAVVILRHAGPVRDAASSAPSLAAVSAMPAVPPLPPPAPPPASASAAAAAPEPAPAATAAVASSARTSKGPALAAPAPAKAPAKTPGGKQPPTKKPPRVDLGF